MSEQSTDGTEREEGLVGPKCPAENCSLSFVNDEEVLSHLQWDHNRSELEARRLMMDV
jgi:hypothetical protein